MRKIISTCQEHPALTIRLTCSLYETSDIVNFLYNAIINYKTVYKSTSKENYIQSDNNRKNNKLFFTHYQYQ